MTIATTQRNWKEKFFDSSITTKIMVMVMTTITGVLLLSFASFLIYDVYFNTRQAIINEVELVARSLSKRAAPVMLFEDQQEGNRVVEEANIKESVILACLYTNRETLLSEYRKTDGEYQGCPPMAPSEVGIIAGWSTIALHNYVRSPNGETVASLYIVSDKRQMTYKLIYTSLWALIFLAIAILFSYKVITKFTFVITTPLLNLSNTAKAVSLHDYSARAQKMYNDECGVLTDAFNEMMQKVEDHKMTLNQIVNKRTKDLRHTVKKLEFTNEELEKANRLKQIWIQNMGHEIRTPIHQVLQFSHFGIEESADESIKREELGAYFSRIQLSANRLCTLIEDLLDFGKLQSGKIKLSPALNDLKETVSNVVEELYGMASAKEITINVHTEEPSLQSVFDKNRLSQVLINLIANAIKFSPEKGVIDITLERIELDQEVAVQVSVKDQGIGIPEGEEESIFDTFTQSSKTYDGSGGTGLGLSISREIVLLHDGEIKANNNPEGENGATFTFTIPMKKSIEDSHVSS